VFTRYEDVTAFEQYLTMGRLDGRWRLKEILASTAGEAAVREENLDQDQARNRCSGITSTRGPAVRGAEAGELSGIG